MSSKSYDKKCARLVQEACGVNYTEALRWVLDHQKGYPDHIPAETRALAIVRASDEAKASKTGLRLLPTCP